MFLWPQWTWLTILAKRVLSSLCAMPAYILTSAGEICQQEISSSFFSHSGINPCSQSFTCRHGTLSPRKHCQAGPTVSKWLVWPCATWRDRAGADRGTAQAPRAGAGSRSEHSSLSPLWEASLRGGDSPSSFLPFRAEQRGTYHRAGGAPRLSEREL